MPRERIGTTLLLGACLLALGSLVLGRAGPKNRNWQIGILLDSERTAIYAGSSGSDTTQTALYKAYQVYTIEVGDFVYVARQRLRWAWSKPAQLTINDFVRVAIERNKLFILDDNRKEHKAAIIKRIRKGAQDPED